MTSESFGWNRENIYLKEHFRIIILPLLLILLITTLIDVSSNYPVSYTTKHSKYNKIQNVSQAISYFNSKALLHSLTSIAFRIHSSALEK